MVNELIARIDAAIEHGLGNYGSLLRDCRSALSEVGEPVAWTTILQIGQGSGPIFTTNPEMAAKWREAGEVTPLYAHPEGDRDTEQEGDGYADDMCPNCVTPWKCNGPHLETTKSRREADLPPAVSRDQTDTPTAQPAVLPDPEIAADIEYIREIATWLGVGCGYTQMDLSGPQRVLFRVADILARVTAPITQNEPSSDSIAPVGLGMQEESKPQTPIGKLNAAYIKEQAERKAAGGKLVDGVYHPPESAAPVGSGGKLFQTSVAGIGPWCLEFPDGEIITSRSRERLEALAAERKDAEIGRLYLRWLGGHKFTAKERKMIDAAIAESTKK